MEILLLFLSSICYIAPKYNSEIRNEEGAISLELFAHKGHFHNDYLYLCITDGFLFYLRKAQFRPIYLSINTSDTSKLLFRKSKVFFYIFYMYSEE